MVKFSDLCLSSFFGTDEIECCLSCIFVKISETKALVVFDRFFGEAEGHIHEVDKNLRIRETYETIFIDEQSQKTKDRDKLTNPLFKSYNSKNSIYVFRTKTDGRISGSRKQVLDWS